MPLVTRGIKETISRVRRGRESLPGVVAAAAYQEWSIEFTETLKRVPVRDGYLKGSGRLEEPEVTPRSVRLLIVYGDGDKVDYALYVHEDLEAFHKNGEAKFVEHVVMESGPYMPERIARRIDWNQVFA